MNTAHPGERWETTISAPSKEKEMEYKETECSCGKIARILFCGIGIYVTCPHCGKTGKIKDTEEEAMESWKEA